MALALSGGLAPDQKRAISSVFWLVIVLGLCELTRAAELSSLSLLGKQANQSSAYGGRSAERAIDGDPRSNLDRYESCTHTVPYEVHPWWMVDLGTSHVVGRIILVNRWECCSFRLTAAVVRAGLNANISQNAICGSPVTSSQASVPGAHLNFMCDPQLPARYVSVDIDGNQPGVGVDNILTLCEVMVEEYPMMEFTSPASPTNETTRASGVIKLIHEGTCDNKARPLSSSLTASLMPCTFQCKRNDECWFFDYAPTTGRCRLYSQRLINGIPDPDMFCLEYAVIDYDLGTGHLCDNPM